MSYRIEQDTRESLGEYTYRIYDGDRLIARYWHDHRGDEHGIEFQNGTRDDWPVGRMVDFIEGGGPQPPTLSAKAIAYLDSKRSEMSIT